jgi:hypothetical protein
MASRSAKETKLKPKQKQLATTDRQKCNNMIVLVLQGTKDDLKQEKDCRSRRIGDLCQYLAMPKTKRQSFGLAYCLVVPPVFGIF